MPVHNIKDNEPYLYEGIWVRGVEEENTVKEQSLYKKVTVKPEDIVLDIGAHIGCSARYFISRGARAVYAYEPMPSNFELLQKNSIGHNIFPIKAAIVGDDRKELELFTPNTRFTTEHSIVNKRGRTSTIVPAISFTAATFGSNPDILKIDIEGGELELLDCLREISIRSVTMEVHYYTNNSRKLAKELKEIMAKNYEEIQPMKYLDGGWNRCIAVWEHK